jgi:hypothetical protein
MIQVFIQYSIDKSTILEPLKKSHGEIQNFSCQVC